MLFGCKSVCIKSSLDVGGFAPKAWTSCCLFCVLGREKIKLARETGAQAVEKMYLSFDLCTEGWQGKQPKSWGWFVMSLEKGGGNGNIVGNFGFINILI